ncbi:MAG: ABC transporter permease [Segetibacter sp.]
MTATKAFSAEILKTKNTATKWLILAGAAFIPLLELAIFLNNPQKVKLNPGENPWDFFLKGTFQFASVFIIPLFVVLATSLIMHIENKSNTWKHILVLPVSKDLIFLSKLLLILCSVIAFYCCFIAFLFLDMGVLKAQLKQFSVSNNVFHWQYLCSLTFQSFISVLAILAIHFWLSLRIKNVIVVVSIGLTGLFIALVLSSPGMWKNVVFFPYALPALISYRLNPLYHYQDVPNNIYGLIFFMIIILLCYGDYKRNFRG